MPLTLQDVEDRLAIRDLLLRYGSALDARDWAALRSVFTPTSRALYAGHDTWLESGDTIVGWIDEMTTHTPWQHHFLSMQQLALEGDQARATTYLVSSQRTDDEPAQLVRMLGTYRDVLTRTPQGWRITERRLELGWAERQEPTTHGA